MCGAAWTSVVMVVVSVSLIGCTSDGPSGASAAPDGAGSDGFVGRTWVSDDPAAPSGRLRIFLADGTLVMDSCLETYRLSRWQLAGDGRISWEEDSALVEADLLEVSADTLRLRLFLRGGETAEEVYRPGTAPFACPDLPRETAALDAGLGAPTASCQ